MSELKFEYSSKTNIGSREEQQDAIKVFSKDGVCAAVVCDGMGGLAGGAQASRLTSEMLIGMLSEMQEGTDIPDFFLRSIDILDEAVFSLCDDEGEKLHAGTTVVSTYLTGSKLYWMSVGDSRLYIFRSDDMIQATRDHNYFLAMNSMAGEFTPTEDDISNGNALISFIGIGGIEVMDISNNPIDVFAGDRLLLTTDGLFKVLTDDEIKDIIKSHESVDDACEILLNEVLKREDELDNISFILIKVSENKTEKENVSDETD